MGNDRLSGKQVGSQASRRVTRRLAWIQPVCKSINAVPALKGLNIDYNRNIKAVDYLLQQDSIAESSLQSFRATVKK